MSIERDKKQKEFRDAVNDLVANTVLLVRLPRTFDNIDEITESKEKQVKVYNKVYALFDKQLKEDL